MSLKTVQTEIKAFVDEMMKQRDDLTKEISELSTKQLQLKQQDVNYFS